MLVDLSIFENWNLLYNIEGYTKLKESFYFTVINDPLPDGVFTCTFSDAGYSIEVPISICFLLNYWKAKDSNDEELKKFFFNNALRVSKKKEFAQLKQKFENKIEECKKYYIRWYKAPYSILYGEQKSEQIRKKISKSMSKLAKEIIKKRNSSIKKYAEKRPKSHNEAIKRGKMAKKNILKNVDSFIWTSKDKSAFRKTPEWKNFTKEIKEERGNKCEFCGIDTGKSLVVHHKYLSNDKRNYTKLEKDRFFVLCPLCHKSIHRWHATWNRKRKPATPPYKAIFDIVEKMVIDCDGLTEAEKENSL